MIIGAVELDLETIIKRFKKEENRTLVVKEFDFDCPTIISVNPPDIPLVIDGILIESSEEFLIHDIKVGNYGYHIHENPFRSSQFKLGSSGTLESQQQISFDWGVCHVLKILVSTEKRCKGKIIFLGQRTRLLNARGEFRVIVSAVLIKETIGPCVEIIGARERFEGIIPININSINDWVRKIGKEVSIEVVATNKDDFPPPV